MELLPSSSGSMSARERQEDYERQLALLKRLDDARESALRLIDYVLQHSDIEAASVDAAVLLQAALRLAEQEIMDAKTDQDAPNEAITPPAKLSKAEKAAIRQAEREADAAAKEVAQAAKRAAQAAAKADKLAGRRSAAAISSLRLDRAAGRLSLLRRSHASGDSEDGELSHRSHRVLNVTTSLASEAIEDEQVIQQAERREQRKAERAKARAEGRALPADSHRDRDDEADLVEALPPNDQKASEKWLHPWRSNGVGGGGGKRETAFDANIGFSGDCLAMDSHGDKLVTVGLDGVSVEIFSVSRNASVRTLEGHTDLVCCVAVKGDLIASAGRDRTIRIWSMRQGTQLAVLEGCEDQVYGLQMRGGLLVSGEGSAKRGRARLWQLRTREPIAVFPEHGGPVWSVAISANQQQHFGRPDVAVSASFDATARVWPLNVPGVASSLATLEHPTWVFSVSTEGELCATGCGDKLVRLWSLANYECLRTLMHDTAGWVATPVFCVRFYGGVLASGGEDKTVKLWSVANDGECVVTLTHGATVRGIAISPKGFVASVGGNAKKLVIWRPAVQGAGDIAAKLLKGGNAK